MTSIIEQPLIKGLSHIKNPSATLPTLLIEACCTSGRTYQSYKRGGTLEAKERFREEVTCAAFWLWGAKALNKIGDVIGEKLFKNITDTGKDFLRDPSYQMSNAGKIFKFTKIILSALIATGLVGFVVPKVNHAITDKLLNKSKNKNKKEYNLNDFIKNAKNENNSNYGLNFKGNENLINGLMKASYNLENKNVWRLISTDTGMLAGRVYNSRHPAERFEYLFRDICSMFFYNFTTGGVIFLLNKIFKKTEIHPKALDEICTYLDGKNLTGKALLSSLNKKNASNIANISFEQNGIIKLKDLVKQLQDLNFGEIIIEKARKMSELQPPLRGERVLSKAQVEDVFSNSISSNPTFLKKVINAATYGRATDPTKFVEAQTCQKIRNGIDTFMLEIANKAGENVISAEFLNKIKMKTLTRTALFQLAGLAFSAVGLAIIIPKMQIFLSQKLYGKQSFEDIANGNKKDGKVPS